MATKCSKCKAENPEDTTYCGKCGTRFGHAAEPSVTRTLETTPEGLGKGKLFAGRFELIEELGAGGMGQVFRAYDKEVGEEIAIKVLHPDIALDLKTVERFRNEIKLARRITHRNVCRMHELHQDGKQLFITMEYVPGQDLKGLIKQTGALPTGQALSIAKQVAEGLAEAHHLGVVHRDLKPQNIMVDKEGNAKIMDFGIARSLRAAGMTAEGMIIGTPEYMAPEQVEGLEADQRTDIYAMGAILFEMATGRAPFEGDSALSVAYKHKNEPPPPPRKLNAEIPEPFNKLILRCLEKQKENRCQTAEELLADLIRIEEGLPISERVVLKARPTIRISREKPTGAKRFIVPALGVVVLALAAFIALRVLPKKHPRAPASGKPTLAVLYFENISGDKNLDMWKTGLTTLMISKLNQSKYINVLPRDRIFSLLKKLNLEEAKTYSTEDLVKIAKEGEATYTLRGSYMKAGKSIIVEMTLQKPDTGEVISSPNIQCDGEEAIFPRVDELGNKIKSDLNLSSEQIASDINEGVGQILTRSPEALKCYEEGIREFNLSADFPAAIKLLEKAIAIDPGFAMAYRALGDAHVYNYEGSKAGENYRKALDLANRLPLRERSYIEASYFRRSTKTVGRAVEALNKLLETYPDDAAGRQLLGETFMFGEEFDRAIAVFEPASRIKGAGGFLSGLLINCYMAKGWIPKAEEFARSWVDEARTSLARTWLAIALASAGKFDQALSETEKALDLDPGQSWAIWMKGQIHHLRGDFQDAEKEYLKLERSEVSADRGNGLYFSGYLYLMQGKYLKAAEKWKAAAELDQKNGDYGGLGLDHYYLGYIHFRQGKNVQASDDLGRAKKFLVSSDQQAGWGLCADLASIGVVYLGLNQRKELQEVTDEIEALVQDQKAVFPKLAKYTSFGRALFDLADRNYSRASGTLGEFVRLSFYPVFVFFGPIYFDELLASTLYAAGDLDNACLAYEKIVSLVNGRIVCADAYSRSFYVLGKIFEQKGDHAKAASNYRKFLDLFKDADPGLPEVEDARNRLAGLTQ